MENEAAIQNCRVKYKIPLTDYSALLKNYAAADKNFQKDFDNIFSKLDKSKDDFLKAYLTVKTLNGDLTGEDAQKFDALASEIGYPLDKEDIFIIGSRYLKTQTPKDVAFTLDMILKRIPYKEIKEENLGLAVKTLIKGSPESLEESITVAYTKTVNPRGRKTDNGGLDAVFKQ